MKTSTDLAFQIGDLITFKYQGALRVIGFTTMSEGNGVSTVPCYELLVVLENTKDNEGTYLLRMAKIIRSVASVERSASMLCRPYKERQK